MTFSLDDGRSKLLDSAIWMKASSPKLDDSRLFLAEGAKLVGKSLFGDAWTGEELLSPSMLRHPDTILRDAQKLQERLAGNPHFGVMPLPSSRAPTPFATQSTPHAPDVTSDPAQWRTELTAIWESESAVRDRLLRAIEWISDHARNKRLSGCLRKKEGGGPLALPADFWFRDDLPEAIFAKCEYKRGSEKYWVFLDRAPLEALLSVLPNGALHVGSDLSRFSPLLKFVVHLAGKWNTDANWTPESNKVLKWKIQQEWKSIHGTELSPTTAEYVMYILKHPEKASGG